MTPEADVESILSNARARLTGAPREALGEIVVPRRILGVARAARIVPAGTAWHLGVLLLGDEGVWATGEVVRAREDAPRGFTAESQRRRADLAAAAFRGGFPEGMPVHVGWTSLDIPGIERGAGAGPLAVRDGIPVVRWSSAGGLMSLASYLDDRIALLREPPPGA